MQPAGASEAVACVANLLIRAASSRPPVARALRARNTAACCGSARDLIAWEQGARDAGVRVAARPRSLLLQRRGAAAGIDHTSPTFIRLFVPIASGRDEVHAFAAADPGRYRSAAPRYAPLGDARPRAPLAAPRSHAAPLARLNCGERNSPEPSFPRSAPLPSDAPVRRSSAAPSHRLLRLDPARRSGHAGNPRPAKRRPSPRAPAFFVLGFRLPRRERRGRCLASSARRTVRAREHLARPRACAPARRLGAAVLGSACQRLPARTPQRHTASPVPSHRYRPRPRPRAPPIPALRSPPAPRPLSPPPPLGLWIGVSPATCHPSGPARAPG